MAIPVPRAAIIKNSLVELGSVGIFGAMAGGVLALFLADQVASSAEYATLLSGFGGAVLGSGMSAFISVILAKQTSRETLDRDISARNAEQQSNALRLMIKSSLVLSDVVASRPRLKDPFPMRMTGI